MNKLQHIFLLLILIVLSSRAFSIDYMSGSGELVSGNETREYNFLYHQNTDDLIWYGTSKWAVKFNFREVYPTLSGASFNISKALIYFPVLGDSATVEFFPDSAGQPLAGQPLASVRTLVNEHNMRFNLAEPLNVEVVWMILSYETNAFGPYVSASQGGGSRSFYLNNNVANPYYQNMALAGYNCEFLFGVSGDFVLPQSDLRLVSIALDGDMRPDSSVIPSFVIYNHSNAPISNVSLNLTLSTPLIPEDTIELTVPISGSLTPNTYFTMNQSHPQYGLVSMRLPSYPSQLRLRAEVISPLGEADPSANNVLVRYLNSFMNPNPLYLTENFLMQDQLPFIATAQDQHTHPQNLPLYYFPILSDSLANIGALQRFNWYGYNSIPRTVLGGSQQIVGYSDTYASDYAAISEDIRNVRTFISDYDCRLNIPDQGEQINVSITLSNTQTRIYSTQTDLNLQSGSRFYVALFKNIRLQDNDRYIFDRFIAYRDTINSGLTMGGSVQKNYSLSMPGLTLAELTQNYAVVFWLQHEQSKQILFSARALVSGASSVEEDNTPAISLRYGPNPLTGGKHLNLEYVSPKALQSAVVHIYNVKGQLLRKQEFFLGSMKTANLQIPDTVFAGKGLYLLKTTFYAVDGSKQRLVSKHIYLP